MRISNNHFRCNFFIFFNLIRIFLFREMFKILEKNLKNMYPPSLGVFF
jgi:hypothetical protein